MFALAITGPTASGKTALSIAVAKRLGAEIISCDSMQIYRGMDIGTAKATPEEQAEIKHHLIDFLSPRENYSVESYRRDALKCAEDISALGKMPLFVGGTGLYIDTVIRGISDKTPGSSPEYRAALLAESEEDGGADRLWQRLKEVDPESADKIHKNNVKRVIRALEIYDATGVPKSQLDREVCESSSDIVVAMITLDFHDRENLYRRVDMRVDEMVRIGLVEEVRALYDADMLPDGSTASQAIGYKELLPYLRCECELSLALEQLKLSSRRYAKRQLTWFRHETDAVRIFVDREDGVLKNIDELASEAILAAEKLINEHKLKSEANR
ncbi:MAG: tRNA (adenosine(37)-N6)-dimethylallyltransferase MiaA [Clostridia bacterium]|nr:tRNA (adenosine(37)-N6)-dimethylallyltransferase MiaA [Clostridia bacterium]